MTDQPLVRERLPDGMRGFLLAFIAYAMWGALPFYLKILGHIPALEVVAHRIIWSVPVAIVLLIIMGQMKSLISALCQPRLLAMAALTATLITINWSIYVWAVAADQLVGAALGYYINPLFSVVLGALFLGESINRVQFLAIGFACAAVLLLTLDAGGLPWISLALPLTFGLYGFFRKSLPLAPLQGFTLEVLILAVPALAYVSFVYAQGEGHFVGAPTSTVIWLLLAGPFTAIPLILYAMGAKLLRLTTLGLMQYMTPTVLFLIAVFAFGEPFSTVQLAAFVLIWIGLALYTWSSVMEHRRNQIVEPLI